MVSLNESTAKIAKSIRNGLEYSLEGFASRLEVSVSTIRNWENGTSIPKGNNWIKLLKEDSSYDVIILDENGKEITSYLLSGNNIILQLAEEKYKMWLNAAVHRETGDIDTYHLGNLKYDTERLEAFNQTKGYKFTVRILHHFSKVVKYEGNFNQF
jgi:transcriptional regulator with XRE-family HTH domain